MTEISASGLTGTNFSGGGLSTPKGVAVDAIGNIWIANSGNNSVTEISTSSTLTNYNGAGLTTPIAIAISPK